MSEYRCKGCGHLVLFTSEQFVQADCPECGAELREVLMCEERVPEPLEGKPTPGRGWKTDWWKFKALQVNVHYDAGDRPDSLWQWIGYCWGWDIFFGRVPFCKSLAAVCVAISVVLGVLV